MTKDWIEVIMEDQSKLYIETTGSMPTGGEDSLMVPAASEGSIIKKTEELLEKSFAQIKRFFYLTSSLQHPDGFGAALV